MAISTLFIINSLTSLEKLFRICNSSCFRVLLINSVQCINYLFSSMFKMPQGFLVEKWDNSCCPKLMWKCYKTEDSQKQAIWQGLQISCVCVRTSVLPCIAWCCCLINIIVCIKGICIQGFFPPKVMPISGYFMRFCTFVN